MHRNSLLLFDKHARPYFRAGLRVLEIGPDTVPSSFRKLIPEQLITWETIDMIPRPGVQWVSSGEYEFPFKSDTFDIIYCAQVLEHVRHPWRWMKELARVTVPGGHVITISPVNWPYHEAPVDCWRIYPEGMRALHDEAGLTTVLAVTESLELRTMKWWKGTKTFRSVLLEVFRRCFSRERPLLAATDTVAVAQKPVGR